ncbi:hypothetical protein K443DRAFT_92450 [Laccaria amethystina LaAM-08-1]|uniref:Uncharacterized protein n=1 Tax=Laccaria amethystina LaAM-08-1 TaxID=1095629 RepID=A0A0C9XSS3_9AGAR|nr:hypothetical protein K443DRAFT_92450 [Laccaria amethystina LaAM-08-1]
MKHVYQNWNEKCAAELGLKMCARTGIKHVYQGNWDETCVPELRLNMNTRGSRGRSPRQAVTGAGGTGLKLVQHKSSRITCLTPEIRNSHVSGILK